MHPHGTQGSAAAGNELRLVFWELTARCNLTCKHCRAEAQDHFVKGELSTQEVFNAMYDL